MENYKYRRQFFLGEEVLEYPEWIKFKIDSSLYLSLQPDLEFTYTESDNRLIIALGFLIDPYHPERSNDEIINDLLNNSKNFSHLIENTYSLSGRWVLIYRSTSEFKLFTDPCGLRQVYYSYENNRFTAGSQPSILIEKFDYCEDQEKSLKNFLTSTNFDKKEKAWYGDGTPFKQIKHLLPNNYLDIKSGEKKRFWVDKEVVEDIGKIAEKGAGILKASLKAAKLRYKLRLGLTAGLDSRVLLAASKEWKNEVDYWVSTMGILPLNHYDIRIPKKLSNRFKLDLVVISNPPGVRRELQSCLENNITLARNLGKTKMIQYHFDNCEGVVNINGNGSEIMRNYYGTSHPREIDGNYLASLVGYENDEYVVKHLEKWVESVRIDNVTGDFSLVDLFYWEQRMGNWGALYPAEQDIAIEEFSPFNNRELIMSFTKAAPEFRKAPRNILYNEIIRLLWEETLSVPINGGIFHTYYSIMLKRLPKPLRRSLKKIKSYI